MRITFTRRRAFWGACAAVLALMAGCAAPGPPSAAGGSAGEPVELTFAGFVSAQTAMGATIEWWADEIERRSNGAIRIDTVPDGALLGPAEIAPGVRDGRADAGHLSPPYYPGQFTLWSVVEIPFVTTNMPAAAEALQDLYETDDAFRAEFADRGLHLLTVVPVPPSMVGGKQPIEGFDDLRGRQMRSIGRIAQAVDAAGAVPAALPVAEIYEGLGRGVIDSYSGMPLDVAGALSLPEVAPFAADPGLGVWSKTGLVISLDRWEALSPEAQEIISAVSEEYRAEILGHYVEGENAACAAIRANGGEVVIWPAEETRQWRQAVGPSIEQAWLADATGAGVDGTAFLERYRSLVEDYEPDFDYETGTQRCAAGQS